MSRARVTPRAPASNGVVVPSSYTENAYLNLLVEAASSDHRRILLGLPTTGLVRIEFVLARYGATIPCNWSMAEHVHALHQVTPLGYDVQDARNVLVQAAVVNDFEWLFFLDHDVILPPDVFLILNEYMRDGTLPVVGGLYFTKSHPSEPLIYRGRGNSYYAKWALGEQVWCDGMGMGCTLLNVKVLREMYNDAPEYLAGGNQKVRQVFQTPQFLWFDPEVKGIRGFQGTEDLAFFDRMLQGGYLRKAGFARQASRKWPLLCDTRLFCRHITQDGKQYPLELRW